MKKKIIKMLKIAIIFFIIFTLISSLIVSQNEYHIEICHENHCPYCAIIYMAQNITNISFAFIIAIIIGVLIYFFLSRLREEQDVFILNSLVFQKVQLNE